MKVEEVVNAYQAIPELLRLYLPFAVIRDVIGLKAAMKGIVEAYSVEEEKLVRAFADVDERGNPVLHGADVVITDAAKKAECARRLCELRGTRVEEALPGVVLSGREIEGFESAGQRLTPQLVLALEGFVEFGGGG